MESTQNGPSQEEWVNKAACAIQQSDPGGAFVKTSVMKDQS